MLIIGIVIMFLGFAVAGCLLAFSRSVVAALIFFALAIIAGVAIANLTRITHLGGEISKGKSSVGLDIQQAVTEVKNDARKYKVTETKSDKSRSECRPSRRR